jgi:ElaB/YqjD/DUF883 family membrane-anchored ribosome-binding protein
MATSKQQADSAIDRMSDSAHRTIDRISEKGEELMDMHEDWIDTARTYVRDNPLQALGIAVAAGYVLSLLTRR